MLGPKFSTTICIAGKLALPVSLADYRAFRRALKGGSKLFIRFTLRWIARKGFKTALYCNLPLKVLHAVFECWREFLNLRHKKQQQFLQRQRDAQKLLKDLRNQ